MAERKSAQRPWLWGAGIAVGLLAVVVAVVNQPKPARTDGQVGVSTVASSAEIERYAARVLEGQKAFFAVHNQYASRLGQLKLAPMRGVIVDYRGSSPLGFCWLVRTEGDVWYTVSQRRVNRTMQPITAPPPISCQ